MISAFLDFVVFVVDLAFRAFVLYTCAVYWSERLEREAKGKTK